MKNWPQDEESIIARLAGIESLLDKLRDDFESTTWRKSALVARCIASAGEELDLSLHRFTAGKVEESIDLANLAWLHVEFGQKLLDAETTEGILGEGHFLELSESTTTSAALLVKYFGRMEQQIVLLRKSISKQLEAREQ